MGTERPVAVPTDRAIRFGPFCLRPTQQLLLENDTQVRIGARALDLLIALVEHAGELVSKACALRSHIALACGMADQAHLSKLFRRGHGEPPGAWRRRSLTDTEGEARSRGLKAGHSMGASP